LLLKLVILGFLILEGSLHVVVNSGDIVGHRLPDILGLLLKDLRECFLLRFEYLDLFLMIVDLISNRINEVLEGQRAELLRNEEV